MIGWLVVNGFLKEASFDGIYSFFLSAAKKTGISLEIKKSSEIRFAVGGAFGYPLPDFIIFWDKDVFLASQLEKTRVPLFNSASAVEKSDSKILTSLCLSENGLPIPKTVISPKTFENIGYNDFSFLKKAAEITGFPMIIKEEFGSFGKQVYLANSLDEAEKIIKDLGYKSFVMQEFVSESRGRDLRINVVGDEVVTAMERYNPEDFRSNVGSGGKVRNITPTEAQKTLALAAAKALGLDFAGVDILLSEKGDTVCEVNSNPHFKAAFDLTGINLGEKILEYIIEKIR